MGKRWDKLKKILNKLVDRPTEAVLGPFKWFDEVKELTPWASPMMGRAWGKYIEENARIAHFLAKRKELGSYGAMKSMNKYLFDYSRLTSFEKQKMRPLFLFYTWMRKNIPLQVNSLFANPRIGATYAKIINQEPGELPRYLRASTAFPSPIGPGYIGSLGMPIEDLNIFNVGDVDPTFFEQLPRLADKFASRASPAVRIPYEFITGHTALSRRPTRELTGETWEKSFWNLTKAYSPTSRFQRVGEKFYDPQRPMTMKWLDFLTGIRTYHISKTRAQLDELRRRAVGSKMYKRAGFLIYPKKKFKGTKQIKQINKRMSTLIKQLQKEKQYGIR